jgi:hypothetical protein
LDKKICIIVLTKTIGVKEKIKMAKVTFSKLSLKKKEEVKEFIYNE